MAGRELIHKQKHESQQTGRATPVAKGKGKKNLSVQAIAVPSPNNNILSSCRLSLEIKVGKAKKTGKLGLAVVEEGNNLCDQSSMCCRVSFKMLITGSNS